MYVCGIDPGLNISGYAILRGAAAHPTLVDAGVFRTNPQGSLPDRLIQLADDFTQVLTQWQPQVIGVEQLYSHYKHPRTAVQMGHARGVLLAAGRRGGAEIVSLSATNVKRFLTGNGRASKSQVQRAVQALFNLPAPPEPPDVADALAVAFAAAHWWARRRLEVGA